MVNVILIMNISPLGTAFGDVVKEITNKLAPQMDKMVILEPAKLLKTI